MSWSSKAKGVMVVAAVLIALAVASVLIPWIACEDKAEGATQQSEREARRERFQRECEQHRQEWARRDAERDARWAKLDAEAVARRTELEAEIANAPVPKQRKVRRFQWESPAETRGKLWNVPEEEGVDALLTAFLRVCIAEADGNTQDCVGIWQVVKNNRRRTCDRGMVRRITECDDDGETMLSALRRHQQHVLGFIKARNKRAVWIANLTPECDMPEGWTDGENRWDALYGSKVCPQVVADTRHLIVGELPPPRPGARVSWLPGRPVTWGGRCESGNGACDDRIACARGLARIENTNTLNAFWCVPGRPGCRADAEPICVQLGYGLTGDVDSPHGQHGQAPDPSVVSLVCTGAPP
jgi:hypothetical protein